MGRSGEWVKSAVKRLRDPRFGFAREPDKGARQSSYAGLFATLPERGKHADFRS